ncbi:phytanoyl-CoA dioxygenase family protein [Linderina pennispora]|uniref:Phytanoyl-CoA dioxygenase family protein n=1 Tax=Linderina pennispora TaxID=61395 RepID=A0A1Y1W7J9_9FUNG|nr:phytanoyl-CoA dioxygenase family protein [Linderina pennispora]ORX69134.1 phytanoyl-CoA dioxygenase family protein [Linderina pennispora]
MFTDAHFDSFKNDGCVVIPGFLSAEEVAALRKRTAELLDSFDPESQPKTTFSTGIRDKHIGDRYFLDSSDKVSYFLEEQAVVDGRLAVDKTRAINKIGHGLHIREPLFAKLSHSNKVRQVAQRLGYDDPRILQSMVICKQPSIGGEVPLHQDSCFLYTRPLSACGFWFALEDCTLANGCLEFIPGSHLETPISKRFFVPIEPEFSLFPPTKDNNKTPIPEQKPVGAECKPIEVKAGSVVLIHGQVLHRSSHNHSDKSRWIYTFHIIEGGYEYDDRNWLQMPADRELTKL